MSFGANVAEMRRAMSRVLAIDASGATIFKVAYEVVFSDASETSSKPKTPQKPLLRSDDEILQEALLRIYQPPSEEQPNTPSPGTRKRAPSDSLKKGSNKKASATEPDTEELDDQDDEEEERAVRRILRSAKADKKQKKK